MGFSNTLGDQKENISDAVIKIAGENGVNIPFEFISFHNFDDDDGIIKGIDEISEKVAAALIKLEKPDFGENELFAAAVFSVFFRENLLHIWFNWLNQEIESKGGGAVKIEDADIQIARNSLGGIGGKQVSKLVRDTRSNLVRVVRFCDGIAVPVVEVGVIKE